MGVFTVVWLVAKQVVNNWRLELSLVVGLIIAVGIFSAIPIYTEGALQLALMHQWEKDSSVSRPPGAMMISYDRTDDSPPATMEQFEEVDRFLRDEMPRRFGTKQQHFARLGGLDIGQIQPVDPSESGEARWADIRYLTDLRENVEIIWGRWPSDEVGEDSQIEVIVDEGMLDEQDLMPGRTYLYKLEVGEREEVVIPCHIVGVFRATEESVNSPRWTYRPPFKRSFFVPEKVFNQILTSREELYPEQYVWYWVFDHENVRVHRLDSLIKGMAYIGTRAAQILSNTRFWVSPIPKLEYFAERAVLLRVLLFVLSIPVFGMVLYYLVLAAGLTIRSRRNEIAMMRSRGASVLQIMLAYGLEWCMLGAMALLAGPQLGLLIAKVMGAAAGFLSFVDRQPLPAIISPNAYRYAFYAAAVSVLGCLLPVASASRFSIVQYKQDLARGSRTPLWQKFFVDFLLLGVAYYGYRALSHQSEILGRAASDGAEVVLDPSLFLVPVIFLFGCGLFALRLFPLAIRLLNLVTNRWAGASWVTTMRQLSRNPGQYSPLIFFISLTVSLGIYSASTARTMDENFIDRLYYSTGADVILTEQWRLPSAGPMDMMGGMAEEEAAAAAAEEVEEEEVSIFEPPFYVHKELPGVLGAARVLRKEVHAMIGGSHKGSGAVLAIDPHDFAEVAWFRSDLLRHHLHEYLNLLIMYREGALVTRKFFEDNKLRLGDWVTLGFGGERVDFFVVGVIDLWPTLYPAKDFPAFIVNLSYVQEQYVIEPYNVWLKLGPGARLSQIVESLREQGIWVVDVHDTRAELIRGRRDPQRMGLFGMLSIGFVVAVTITIIGFFLYTFLSLKGRLLQFGVLRAIGLSVSQLISMLVWEQVFSVGLGLGLGTLLGRVSSEIFLPFLQVSGNMAEAVPKFLIVTNPSDLVKIYAVLGTALFFGICGLAVLLARLRLHQAIKLGEEL